MLAGIVAASDRPPLLLIHAATKFKKQPPGFNSRYVRRSIRNVECQQDNSRAFRVGSKRIGDLDLGTLDLDRGIATTPRKAELISGLAITLSSFQTPLFVKD